MTAASVWDDLDDDLVALAPGNVHRDGRDCPMVFVDGYDKPLDWTVGKTIRGRSGYTRATTFIDCLDDKTNLAKYGQRNVLIGIANRPHYLAAAVDVLAMGDTDDLTVKQRLNYLVGECEDAAYAKRKAEIGTALHTWAELADKAITVDGLHPSAAYAMLEEGARAAGYDRHLRAYLKATAHLMRPVVIEELVIVDELKVAGSPDRMSEWTGPEIQPPSGPPIMPGDVVVADVKSGDIEFGKGKIAMQLGIYANAVRYDQDTNTRTELPERMRRDWGVIIHLPAGTGECHLVWVDIAAGWKAAKDLAVKVRAHRTASRKWTTPIPGPSLADQIGAAWDVDELAQLWRDNRADWSADLTEAARVKSAALAAAVIADNFDATEVAA